MLQEPGEGVKPHGVGKKVQQRQQPQPRKNGQGARSAQHLNDLIQQYADHGYVNNVAPVYGKMLKHGVFLAAMCMLQP